MQVQWYLNSECSYCTVVWQPNYSSSACAHIDFTSDAAVCVCVCVCVAYYTAGGCYYNGHGVMKDLVKAAELYAQAAEQGDADAQYRLGECMLTVCRAAATCRV